MDYKFRAWDEELEVFYYSDVESDEYVFGITDGKLGCWAIETITPSDPMEAPYPDSREVGPVEMFTGRKDVNNIRAYQGDMVDALGYKNWLIVLYDDGWKLELPDVLARLPIPRDFTITGSIHENPELKDGA